MSRAFDAKQHVLAAYPKYDESATELFLDYLECSKTDFEYEFSVSPEEYIYGNDIKNKGPE